MSTANRTWALTGAALALLGLTAGYVAVRWKDIPERFATHFGTRFEPDSWSDKSVASVFFPTIFGAVLVLFFVLIAAGILRWKPSHGYTAMWLAVMNLTLAIMFASLQVVTVLHTDWVAPATVGSLVLVLGASLAMVVALARKQNNTTSPSTSSDEHYKWGMFYYNPEDPAVMVDKRFGVGVDFNYAHWQGKAFLAFIALVLLASISLPFLL
ncbi:DUF5808 domain-containing protein [uncultured Corynebacterium sp.]|uniref:DUF5808 domain-containing protein n=1 Tax=uncultured Corynebacterium sp. TaxID=159447 RepID=UPI00263950D0|nr:DUF5808 domain-containing protein [uncultured Corynebacterium sp.]